ncbi:MAG: phosphatase PAP2 family protein [Pseudoxanthomonas sp.]|nr:phosphatase PAP2 family protein [Pseudoxanthomonas sp.]
MFEVDANLWLQQFQAPWFVFLMNLMSELGRSWIFTPVLVLLAFGVRLRPALGVMLALVLVGAATDSIKMGMALPRPSEIDARVLEKGRTGEHVVADGAARTFWGLPDDQAIAAVRATGRHDYGFISGHVSTAAALAISLALVFGARKRRWWLLALAWPVLMAGSRMHLGRHFLGDVLGGFIAGLAAAGMAWALLRWVDPARRPDARRWIIPAVAVLGVALLSLAWPVLNIYHAGSLGGLLLCLAWVDARAVPDAARGPWRRIGSAACALAFVLAAGAGLEALYAAGGWPEGHAMSGLFALVGYPLSLLGALWLVRAVRLFPARREPGMGEVS